MEEFSVLDVVSAGPMSDRLHSVETLLDLLKVLSPPPPPSPLLAGASPSYCLRHLVWGTEGLRRMWVKVSVEDSSLAREQLTEGGEQVRTALSLEFFI